MTDTTYKLLWAIVGGLLVCLIAIAGKAQEAPRQIAGGYVCASVDDVHTLLGAIESKSPEDVPDSCFIIQKQRPVVAIVEGVEIHETPMARYAIVSYTFLPPLMVNLVHVGETKLYEVGYGWWGRPQSKGEAL